MFESEVTIEEAPDDTAIDKPKPKTKASPRVTEKLADKAVISAARKVASTVRKVATRTSRKKPE